MPRPPSFAPHWATAEAGHGTSHFTGKDAAFWIVKNRSCSCLLDERKRAIWYLKNGVKVSN